MATRRIFDDEVIDAVTYVWEKRWSDHVSYLNSATHSQMEIFLYFPLEKVPKEVKERFIQIKETMLNRMNLKLPKAKERYITDSLGYDLDSSTGVHSDDGEVLCYLLTEEEWKQLKQRREVHRAELERQRVEEEKRKHAELEAAREAEWQAKLAKQSRKEERQREALYGSTREDGTASGALMIYGFSGSGKSYFLGNGLCFENLKRGIGTVVIDPIGGTINAFLTRVAQDAPELEERIIYCNMSGERVGDDIYVPSFPLLYRKSDDEELYGIAQKFINTIARTERSFSDASIQGISRLRPLLTRISMVLAAHGLPLTHALDMLDEPEEWIPYFKQLENHPEAALPAKRLSNFFFAKDMSAYTREQRTEPLRNRLSFLDDDRISRAMFGQWEPTVDFDQVAQEGKIVLLDFQTPTGGHVHELRLFWVWSQLMEFVDSRTATGKDQPPLSIIMDELSYFTSGSHLNVGQIVTEFTSFIQQKRRNANIHFAGATQELAMLPKDPPMQDAVQMIPNQLYGKTTSTETAMRLAERYYEFDPQYVKEIGGGKGQVVANMRRTNRGVRMSRGYELNPDNPLDIAPVFMSQQEQQYLNSRNFMKLNQGEWLLGAADGNRPANTVEKITIGGTGIGVDVPAVSEIKQRLAKWHGVPVKTTTRPKLAAADPVMRKNRIPETKPETDILPENERRGPRRRT